MTLKLVDQGTNVWSNRTVHLDVWTGRKGVDLEYVGTTEIGSARKQIGLPLGKPLVLALAFEERSDFGSQSSMTAIELPMNPLRPGDAWRIDVSYTRDGFQHDLRRMRYGGIKTTR